MHNGPFTPQPGRRSGRWLVSRWHPSNPGLTTIGPVETGAELNDAMADSGQPDGEWLILGHDPARLSPVLAPDGAVVVSPETVDLTVDSTADSTAGFTKWLDGQLTRWSGGDMEAPATVTVTAPPSATPLIAIRTGAALAVGGFDETADGLGLADLIARLRGGGWPVVGAPVTPLGLHDLEPDLSPRARLRSLAGFHRRHGRPGDFGRYRTRVIGAAAGILARSSSTGRSGTEVGTAAKQILADARHRWPQPRPDQSQHGVGSRADWRFLLPVTGADHLLITGTSAKPGQDSRHHLEVDGWAERVSFGPLDETKTDDPADVVFIGLGGSVAKAMRHAASDATVVVELDRGPIGRLRRLRSLRSAGYRVIQPYLVTPELATAKRYVPLTAEAIGWLLAQPPPIAGTRTGPARAAVGFAIRAAAALVPRLAAGPFGPAVAGAGAQGLVVATSASTSVTGAAEAFIRPVVLMTSGHDEGSRAIIITPATAETSGSGSGSTGGRGSGGGSTGGSGDLTVTKLAPRPKYNGNTEAEAEAIDAVKARLTAGPDPAKATAARALLPIVRPPVVFGSLRGARERYAGRWTATDLCNRAPESREAVLAEVLAAIDTLGIASTTSRPPWSQDLYEAYLGGLFRRYRARIGWRPILGALEASLAERSQTLVGTPIPLVQRHYDLGPWNVVYHDRGGGLTVVDWEVAGPRTIGQDGLGGADQLYFLKYWLHIAMETRSLNDELRAFEFLTDMASVTTVAAAAYRRSLDRHDIDPRFVPLLAGHLWLEAALYTSVRRADNGGEPGSAARYLETLANHRSELLRFWS